jgi:CheY-like chemotaxis protein
MPKVNGIELLQYIKSIEDLKDKPCIMLSGDSDNSMIAKCIDYGAVHYFVKPLSIPNAK